MTVSHRPAIEADLPQIVEIYNSTIASRQVTADLEPVSVASRLPLVPRAWVRLATDLGRGRSGQCRCLADPVRLPCAPGLPPYREISIYVRDRARGRGIGAYLLECAMRQAASLEIQNLVGLIFEHNAPSLRLFERYGFTRWGSLPRVAVLDGVERNLVIVGWRADG